MGERVRILIVEDEPVVYAEMRGHLQRLGYEVTACVKNGSAALEEIAQNKPDIALVDIMLEGEMDGVQLAEEINKKHALPFIYVTANADQATIERVKFTRPAGFVVKPFDEHDLLAGVEIALYRHAQQLEVKSIREQVAVTEDPIIDNSIFIKDDHRLVRLDLSEILYVEAMDNYNKIYCEKKRYITRGALSSISDQLSVKGFIRVHRSYLVNASKISSLGEKELQVGEVKVPVSRRYRQGLVQAMKVL